MTESPDNLLIDVDEQGIAVITINRQDKLNALNTGILDELDEAFDALSADGRVRGVILTGAGEKAFVAGADIKELAGLDPESGRRASRKGQTIFEKIEAFPAPVIAVVNGYALGGGAELALACHLRVAGGNAMFGFPEVGLGLIPGYGGTQRLARLAGRGRALELILTGDRIGAERAETLGLVNRVAAPGEALETAKKLLATMLKNAPVALASAIRAVYAAGTPGGFATEAELFGELCGTQDFREGTAAFLEKRKPEFRGR